MKKGLRRQSLVGLKASDRFKTCPDEEGIKTMPLSMSWRFDPNSKLALMKKGLRLRAQEEHCVRPGIQNLP